MSEPIPDFNWYAAESKRLGLASMRCPFARLHGCPKYYESRALLGQAGSTPLAPELEAELHVKWKGHPLAPNEMEQTPALSGGGERWTSYTNFCPEVLFDRFGLFVTSLHRFHDELDQAARHQSLKEKGAAENNPLWDWSGFRAQHYSECPVYAPLCHDWPKHARPAPTKEPESKESTGEYDVFISHASEDKNDFARPLSAELKRRGLVVWFDEDSLEVGDSLREKIDDGLAKSRYGVVVLSHAFFRKSWPQAELDALVTRQMKGRKVILPVYHEIDHEDVERYSQLLAARLGTHTNKGVDAVADEIMAVVRPAKTKAPSSSAKREVALSAGEHIRLVVQRFVQVFNEHGVATSQIPRFIPEASLDKLRSWDVLASILTPEVLDKTAKLFGLRRMWLDGIGNQIYDRRTCYKQPEVFFQDLINLESPAYFPASAIIDCERLNRRSKKEQSVVLVLADHLTDLEEVQVCRYTIYADDFSWDYWKCRYQIKAMARIYREATGEIFPIFRMKSTEELRDIEHGRRVPRVVLEGQHDLNRNLEEYAVYPGEGNGAPEMEEAPKVQEYIREEKLEEWGKRLKESWQARGRKRTP